MQLHALCGSGCGSCLVMYIEQGLHQRVRASRAACGISSLNYTGVGYVRVTLHTYPYFLVESSGPSSPLCHELSSGHWGCLDFGRKTCGLGKGGSYCQLRCLNM